MMRVLVHTYFPLLSGRLSGGAQVALDSIVRGLADRGVRIVVASPPPPPGRTLLEHEGLVHVAELRAVEDPDATPPALHHDLQTLARLVDEADVVLTVDTGFPLPRTRPIILMLNNFSYGPETRSVFGLNWDALLVPSTFLHDCVAWYFGPKAWSGVAPPISIAPPPVKIPPRADVEARRSVRRKFGVAETDLCLTFPHRADPHKGFEVALAATLELRRRGHPAVLLVSEQEPSELYPHQRTYVRERNAAFAHLDSPDIVCRHRWIAHDDMASYLQAADWTLCPSRLDESFGLAVLESVAAGVPVIATPAGAIPSLLPPEHGMTLVEFDDATAIADVIEAGRDARALARGRAHVARELDVDRSIDRWLELLAGARPSSARYVPTSAPDPGLPWLRELPSGRVWHHLERNYVEPRTASA